MMREMRWRALEAALHAQMWYQCICIKQVVLFVCLFSDVYLYAPACTLTTQKNACESMPFHARCRTGPIWRASPLSSQLWPTYSYTHCADPTSVHAACSGHCGSTHLLPHTRTEWATAGPFSLYMEPAAHSPWWSLKFQPAQYSHT